MQNSILFINPLQPGKYKEYKAFTAEITGPRTQEYTDLLNRYGLKNTQVYYHKLEEIEFVIVTHAIEDYAPERLASWASSPHPFDLWFKEQLSNLIDFNKNLEQPQLLFTYGIKNM